jgi:hypothetical protein
MELTLSAEIAECHLLAARVASDLVNDRFATAGGGGLKGRSPIISAVR